MNSWKIIHTTLDDPRFQRLPDALYSSENGRKPAIHQPDPEHLSHCCVLLKNSHPVGRFAFYLNPELSYNGASAAAIGSYECIENSEASGKLLSHAIQLTEKSGRHYLIGPMDGSTWNNYRFSDHHQFPNFFMEPYHQLYYHQQLTSAGFQPIAKYTSRIGPSDAYDPDTLSNYEKKYLQGHYHLRPLNLQQLESELFAIAELCIDGFANNFLYTPIPARKFVDKYLKLKPWFKPELIQILEGQEGKLQAMCFAIEDHYQADSSPAIIKSLVKRKGMPLKGLGSYLVGKSLQTCHQLGYEKVIHAMMKENGGSVSTSKKHSGTPFKTYTLYGYKL